MNVTHDITGRPYLKLSEAKENQVVELDGGFTCQIPCRVILHKDSFGLYFDCNEGKHFIFGQADDGEHCIGIYKVQS